MAENRNFRWLSNDIDSSLILKVVYKKNNVVEDYGVFNVSDVLDVTGDKIDVETANIDDLTNLLTVGIVRFVNIINNDDILDIPFRNLYMLYEKGNVLEKNDFSKIISFKELDAFSVIDGTVKNDFSVFSVLISKITDDLKEVIDIASQFGGYGMQEKFDALTRITIINHRRLLSDRNSMCLK